MHDVPEKLIDLKATIFYFTLGIDDKDVTIIVQPNNNYRLNELKQHRSAGTHT